MRFSLPSKLSRAFIGLFFVLSMCISFFAMTGVASARTTTPTTTHWNSTPICDVDTAPSMVEMGEGPTFSSIATVITVECRPVFAESRVTITADELWSRCAGTLSWFNPITGTGAGESFDVFLDNDGGANAVVWGGPSCSAGTSLITASLDAPPFTTVTTTFTVRPPQNTPAGVKAVPSSEVEDDITSSAQTVIQVEFPSVFSQKIVKISAVELNARCAGGITWVGPDEIVLGTGPSVFVPLDNNGNAFVVALAGPSCASGTSLIEASLTIAPFTTYTTTFKILSPRPTCTASSCP